MQYQFFAFHSTVLHTHRSWHQKAGFWKQIFRGNTSGPPLRIGATPFRTHPQYNLEPSAVHGIQAPECCDPDHRPPLEVMEPHLSHSKNKLLVPPLSMHVLTFCYDNVQWKTVGRNGRHGGAALCLQWRRRCLVSVGVERLISWCRFINGRVAATPSKLSTAPVCTVYCRLVACIQNVSIKIFSKRKNVKRDKKYTRKACCYKETARCRVLFTPPHATPDPPGISRLFPRSRSVPLGNENPMLIFL